MLPLRPNTAADRRGRNSSGKTKPSARKTPNCGSGCSRPSSFLCSSNRIRRDGPGHGVEPQPNPRLAGDPPGCQGCPSRSTIHRWVQAAGKAAGVVLKQLDHSCKTLVLVGCLDEIFFHGRPVLVGVEPQSMVWFLGKKADNCQGSTWFEELQPWTSLGYVASDAGPGLQAGIAQMQQHRRETEQVPLEKGLDVFHTKQEAQRVLSTMWNRVERLWEQAEAATRAVEQAQRQGRDSRALAQRPAWPGRRRRSLSNCMRRRKRVGSRPSRP